MKFIISIIAAFALYKLWGTAHNILWWIILVLFILDWLTGETVKTAARDNSGGNVVRFWVWANMGVTFACLIFSIVGIFSTHFFPEFKSQASDSKNQHMIVVENGKIDKLNCKNAIMSFIKAHEMQSDKNGNIVQLSEMQEEEMKSLINDGIRFGLLVSKDFLNSVHPKLKVYFKEHLLKGWKLYLAGLETNNASQQMKGIEDIQKWVNFKGNNADLLYKSIIE
ncbi:MAG: hypothetical protein PF690_06830 [Deltaproteobacteria bacterium]|jgi:hypothetical protein|nr:hypothetical protein [Deltaproteobacteria bacterium]